MTHLGPVQPGRCPRTFPCVPHYSLVMDDGDALGPIELDGRADAWPNGRIIERDGESRLRVVGYLDAKDPEKLSVLVVESAD